MSGSGPGSTSLVYEPVPFSKWLGLVFMGCIPAAAFIALFALEAFALPVYSFGARHYERAEEVAMGAVGIAVFAWFIKAGERHWTVRLVLGLAFTATALVGVVIAQHIMPVAPIAAYIIVLPVWAWVVKRFVEIDWRCQQNPEPGKRISPSDGNIEAYQLFRMCWTVSIAVAALVWAWAAVAGFMRWGDEDFEGGDSSRDIDQVPEAHSDERVREFLESLDCEDGRASCLRPFLMWAFPVVAGIVNLSYAFVAFILVDMDQTHERNFVLVFGLLVALIWGSIWVAAELASSSAHLSNCLSMFAMICLVGLFLLIFFYKAAIESDIEYLAQGDSGKDNETEVQDKAAQNVSKVEGHTPKPRPKVHRHAPSFSMLPAQGKDKSTQKHFMKYAEYLRMVKKTVRDAMEGPHADWVWATVMITPAPIVFFVYLAADMLRTAFFQCITCEQRSGQQRRLSKFAHDELQALMGSGMMEVGESLELGNLHEHGRTDPTPCAPNWTSRLSKAIVVQMIFISVNVGVGKVTMIVLSALITALEGVNLALVIVSFVALGVFLFMIPVVPGIPVYLTGGLVVTSAARATLGYTGALILAICSSFALKLLAVFIQQELIGKYLSGYVWVRSVVAVNSEQTRAIKHILSQQGLTVAKVCILVGGPDWPTSVLAGILGCNVWQCLLGTLPVILVIAPQCVVGAFEGRDPPVAPAVSNLILSAAAVIAMMPLFLAMYFITATVKNMHTKLAEEPWDKDVLALEEKSKRAAVIYITATHWFRERLISVHMPPMRGRPSHKFKLRDAKASLAPLPAHMKATLLLGYLCAWLCANMVFVLGDKAFLEFEITDTVEDKLGGNVLNIVTNYGWMAVGLHAASILAWWGFRRMGRTFSANLDSKLMEIDDKFEIYSQSDERAGVRDGRTLTLL